MTVVDSVQRVMEWLSEKVCPLVTLKVPPERQDEDAEGYPFETAHPAVLGMYWPAGAQMCPPGVESPHPGILVQVVSGEDDVHGRTERLSLRLHLSAWNPGRHGGDAWYPDADAGGYVRGSDASFSPGYDDGWRDAWSFLDVVVRELRNAPDFGGMAIDRGRPIEFGPYDEQGAIVDLPPYWFARVDVSLVCGEPSPTYLSDFL